MRIAYIVPHLSTGGMPEYLRNKIHCKNIETNEDIILDGIKEVLEYLHISKNKYYTHIKTGIPIKEKFICVKIWNYCIINYNII